MDLDILFCLGLDFDIFYFVECMCFGLGILIGMGFDLGILIGVRLGLEI